jgi:multicomponent K+:H+ antiporter subunit G
MISLPLWVTIPGSLLLVIAGLASLIGSIGLLRFKEFFARMHGPSMGNTVGVGAVLTTSFLSSSALAGYPSFDEVLIALFMVMSSPMTAITLMQAAQYRNRARNVSTDTMPTETSMREMTVRKD